MPPRTAPRSVRSKRANSLQDEEDEEIQTSEQATEEYVSTVQSGLDQLLQQVKALRERNAELEAHVEKSDSLLRNAREERTKQRGSDNSRTIQRLEQKVQKLTIENMKQKHRIKELEKLEIQHELQDLEPTDEGDDDSGLIKDVMAQLKKLLRRFSDLMVAPTIDIKDECPVCMELLLPEKCSVLSCQHIICNECLPKLSKGADETIHCAECRAVTERDDVGLVQFTNEAWWDEMTKVAKAWKAIDRNRTEMETSEEEEEENLIDDGDTENSDADSGIAGERDDSEEGRKTSSSPSSNILLRTSASPDKRKRIEKLEEIAAKKRRK